MEIASTLPRLLTGRRSLALILLHCTVLALVECAPSVTRATSATPTASVTATPVSTATLTVEQNFQQIITKAQQVAAFWNNRAHVDPNNGQDEDVVQGLTKVSGLGLIIKDGDPNHTPNLPSLVNVGVPIYVVDVRLDKLGGNGPALGAQVTGAFVFRGQLYFASFSFNRSTIQDLGSCWWYVHNPPPGTECSAGPIDVGLLGNYSTLGIILYGPKTPADLQLLDQLSKRTTDPSTVPTLWFDGYSTQPPTIVTDPTQLNATIPFLFVVTSFP